MFPSRSIDWLGYYQHVGFSAMIMSAALTAPCQENTIAQWEGFTHQHYVDGEGCDFISCNHRYGASSMASLSSCADCYQLHCSLRTAQPHPSMLGTIGGGHASVILSCFFWPDTERQRVLSPWDWKRAIGVITR